MKTSNNDPSASIAVGSQASSQRRRLLDLGKQVDGARILYEVGFSAYVYEGYVREFSPRGIYVRISATNRSDDVGRWIEVVKVVVLEVLEGGKE